MLGVGEGLEGRVFLERVPGGKVVLVLGRMLVSSFSFLFRVAYW